MRRRLNIGKIIVSFLKMSLSKEEFKYFVTNFRTKRQYLVFQVFQLVLALLIITLALSNISHFKTPVVLWLEVLLLATMAVDLFVIRWISSGNLASTLLAKIDIFIFCVFAVTLCFLVFSTDEEEDEILETDDIIIILIVVSRYTVQIVRMVFSIKETHENRVIQSQIKEIDLNVEPAQNMNQTQNFNKELKKEEQFRAKLTKKSHKCTNMLVEQYD